MRVPAPPHFFHPQQVFLGPSVSGKRVRHSRAPTFKAQGSREARQFFFLALVYPASVSGPIAHRGGTQKVSSEVRVPFLQFGRLFKGEQRFSFKHEEL